MQTMQTIHVRPRFVLTCFAIFTFAMMASAVFGQPPRGNPPRQDISQNNGGPRTFGSSNGGSRSQAPLATKQTQFQSPQNGSHATKNPMTAGPKMGPETPNFNSKAKSFSGGQPNPFTQKPINPHGGGVANPNPLPRKTQFTPLEPTGPQRSINDTGPKTRRLQPGPDALAPNNPFGGGRVRSQPWQENPAPRNNPTSSIPPNWKMPTNMPPPWPPLNSPTQQFPSTRNQPPNNYPPQYHLPSGGGYDDEVGGRSSPLSAPRNDPPPAGTGSTPAMEGRTPQTGAMPIANPAPSSDDIGAAGGTQMALIADAASANVRETTQQMLDDMRRQTDLRNDPNLYNFIWTLFGDAELGVTREQKPELDAAIKEAIAANDPQKLKEVLGAHLTAMGRWSPQVSAIKDLLFSFLEFMGDLSRKLNAVEQSLQDPNQNELDLARTLLDAEKTMDSMRISLFPMLTQIRRFQEAGTAFDNQWPFEILYDDSNFFGLLDLSIAAALDAAGARIEPTNPTIPDGSAPRGDESEPGTDGAPRTGGEESSRSGSRSGWTPIFPPGSLPEGTLPPWGSGVAPTFNAPQGGLRIPSGSTRVFTFPGLPQGPTWFVGSGTAVTWGPQFSSSIARAEDLLETPALSGPTASAPATNSTTDATTASNTDKITTIENPRATEATIQYVVNGQTFSMQPAFEHSLPGVSQWTVGFDRGGEFGQAEYMLTIGQIYYFAGTERGWELFQRTTNATIDNSSNDSPFNILVDGKPAVVPARDSLTVQGGALLIVTFDPGNGQAVERRLEEGKKYRIGVTEKSLYDLFDAARARLTTMPQPMKDALPRPRPQPSAVPVK